MTDQPTHAQIRNAEAIDRAETDLITAIRRALGQAGTEPIAEIVAAVKRVKAMLAG